jgi:aerobic C4-dicarboxylate transport protein
MALILGVDRFMSECRSLTNFVGNAMAAIVVARWEGELDRDRLAATLDAGRPLDDAPEGAPAHVPASGLARPLVGAPIAGPAE